MGKQSREKLARRSLAENGEKKKRVYFQTDLEKICLFVVRWGTYLVLLTPLIVQKDFFFPFVAPKTIFFRIMIEIILAAYLFLAIANSRYRPRINILTITLVLFLLVFILASFTGVNLERSFWSTNERMTGIFTMLHLFAFFVVLSSTFKRRQDWEKILGASIIVGVLLSVWDLFGSDLSSRGGATIGNTSFMAAYLLFDIFFAIALLLSKRGFWQIFSTVSLLIMLPALMTSTGRGAIGSFFIGLFLIILGYLIFSQKKKLKRIALAIILALLIFSIISAVFQPSFIKNRVTDILSEMKSRFVVWETGWKGFLERPILGWGPENFNNVFLKYFNPCMFLPQCGSEIWFDRTHNIVFDTLVTTGLVGLLSYLAVFGTAIVGLLKTLPKIVERRNIFLPLTMAVLLIVYFLQNLLVFDMINTYLVFFLTLAFISFLLKGGNEEEIEVKTRRVHPALGLVIIVFSVWILWVGNIQPARANHYLIKSLQAQYINDATDYFQKSLDSQMNKYEPREQFVQRIMRSVSQGTSEEIKNSLRPIFDSVEVEMEKSIEENYLDFRHYLFLGGLYNSSYRLSGQTSELDKAEQILQKAVQLSPNNQQGYWYLAETRMAQGRTDEALSLLQKAIDLEPELGQSYWYLGMTYRGIGQYQLAKEKIIEARKLDYGWQNISTDLQKVIEVYLALGDDAGLIPIYQEAIKINPEDEQLWAGLAASYANLGMVVEARQAAEKALEINPDLAPEVEQFLKRLSE
ncbi:MAG: O-antigen ligase family protein [Candidatus Nealsonbacteria bacterium]|nr:O-antigen ligase family protein [Candidatus Nealsonbacteria bacterium]